MAKKVTHKEHRRHMHHALLYIAIITGLIITIFISLITYNSVKVCQDVASDTLSPEYSCIYVDQARFGWPFIQVSDEAYWPSLMNWALYFVLVFAVAKTEAHHKGHMPKPKTKKK